MSKNVLMITPNLLKERSAVHTNIDDKLIYPEIKASQDMYIMPLLGSKLFNKIITDIENNALSGVYKSLVDDYLIDTLMAYVMMDLPQGLNYQFWNVGVVSVNKDGSNMPSKDDMFSIVDRYKTRAEFYAKRTMLYLMQEQGSFPEYREQTGGLDSVYPNTTSFSSPIYLGEDIYTKPNASYNEPWINYYNGEKGK